MTAVTWIEQHTGKCRITTVLSADSGVWLFATDTYHTVPDRYVNSRADTARTHSFAHCRANVAHLLMPAHQIVCGLTPAVTLRLWLAFELTRRHHREVTRTVMLVTEVVTVPVSALVVIPVEDCIF